MAVERRNYRKVYQRIWRNPEFHGLDGDGKVLALYLLTGPQTNRVGMFRFSAASAAEDLGQSVAQVQATLAAVCVAFGWRWDGASRVLLIPSWWTFNPLSEGTRNLAGYLSDLNDVPRTVLAGEFCSNLADIPDGQRHLVQAWEQALTPRQNGHGPVGDTVASPVGDTVVDGVGDTVGDGVGDPALTTKTCTKTCTKTNTRLNAAPPPDTYTPSGKRMTGMSGTTDPVLAERAGRFIDRFSAIYSKYRSGATYFVRPAKDWTHACNLVTTFESDRLEKLAVVFMNSNEPFIEKTARGLGVFESQVSWCDEQLRRAEKKSLPGAA